MRENRGRRTWRVEWILFVLLLACYGYFPPRWADWNQNSRFDLVLAIVDRGTLSIDAYAENTGDFATLAGRRYSDKAPGLSYLAVPVYAVAGPILRTGPVRRALTDAAQAEAFRPTLRPEGSGVSVEKVHFAAALWLVTLVVVSLPAALLGVLVYHAAGMLTDRVGHRLAVALLYGLVTSAFPYSAAFYGHQVAATLLFAAFSLARRIRDGGASARWIPGVGLLLGYAVVTEYPAGLIALAIGLYLLASARCWRATVGLVLGGVPPALLLMAHDLAIFGTIWPVGYRHSTLYQELHGQGFLSLVGPRADALWGITFGPMRGLFFTAPVLLLAAPGFWGWWRGQARRAELWMCLWAAVALLLFNGSSVMWQGGFAVGPRYVVPMLPFMAMGLAGFLARWGDRTTPRAVVVGLGLWSFGVVWAETLAGQGFPGWTGNPLLDYSLPRLAAGDVARNLGMALGLAGWSSLLPLGAVGLTLLAALARATRAEAVGAAGSGVESRIGA